MRVQQRIKKEAGQMVKDGALVRMLCLHSAATEREKNLTIARRYINTSIGLKVIPLTGHSTTPKYRGLPLAAALCIS